MDFKHHPKFLSEMDDFVQRFCNGKTDSEKALQYIENLLEKHFSSTESFLFSSKHLGKAPGFEGLPVYWLHMIITDTNLSRTQMPKAYFYRIQGRLSILCLGTHVKNYDDGKLRAVAKKRLTEIS